MPEKLYVYGLFDCRPELNEHILLLMRLPANKAAEKAQLGLRLLKAERESASWQKPRSNFVWTPQQSQSAAEIARMAEEYDAIRAAIKAYRVPAGSYRPNQVLDKLPGNAIRLSELERVCERLEESAVI